MVKIAIDGMGGDRSYSMVLEGLSLAIDRINGVSFKVFGDSRVLLPAIEIIAKKKGKVFSDAIECVHTEQVIDSDMPPAQALRFNPNNSLTQAILSHKNGDCSAVVSAGNTGAYMALAKLHLKTLESVERPALVAIWPNLKFFSIVLDVGVNISATPEQLLQFAIMGSEYRIALGKQRPVVGLLSNGTEEIKGTDLLKQAHKLLNANKDLFRFEYVGFVESKDMVDGRVDVLVTDGFTGNIALKMAESTAYQVGKYLESFYRSHWLHKLSYLMIRNNFALFRKKIDPRTRNGGLFIGLNGNVIKSHGGADGLSFCSAIEFAVDVVEADINTHIVQEISKIKIE